MINVITLEETRLNQLIEQAAESGAKKALEHFAHKTETADQSGDIEFAAKVTGLAVSTIYGLCSRRKIPFSKPAGKLLFWRSELIAWINKSKKRTVDEITSR